MNKLLVWASLSVLSPVLGCTGGTETGNPASLTDFSSSTCKNKASSPAPQALTLASDADGLQCVEWTTSDSALQLRLLNFPEPCGEKYFGSATLTTAGTLELSVYKDICAVAACGSCVFDFEYELTGVPREAALPLRIGHATCESEPITFTDQLTLPLDDQPSGTTCRYMDAGALTWYAGSRGTCGQRNMPCGDCNQDLTTCEQDLVCTTLAMNDARCLTSCSSDDDCKPGLTSCQDGACRANASF
jgi:hypothetical protein